jgi:hypothetical protein
VSERPYASVQGAKSPVSHSPDTDYFGLLRPLVASALRNTLLLTYGQTCGGKVPEKSCQLNRSMQHYLIS